MLTSAITVLERRTEFTGGGATVPYEAGWASEAIFFVQADGDHPPIVATPEISPDGFAWVPLGPTARLVPGDHVVAIPLAHFGTWIRLRIEGPAPDTPATLLVHLSLKG